ncbi:MAG: pyridine nucleotide-disulfide oxidoreductase [Candidatus Riflebacteria bacterium HGW-Riflebacteria-1]|jgi:NADPH-dependent 2,4-dienoyl-CoA reductase/sulfur reductase-like enzyme/peroxiredoxin family protein/TusA-related sulfurtransferase/rhodanese-related sulfurtransferase|nr:MAG: pyridine nucleotide-disulfide oxidoreductase [Candidatus Riflebacteria bacterium HGW-Riflebacteria-1]
MKILIVGGVAGGASAAARARRLDEKAEIILFERGEHISFANCGLPYHIGGVIPERESLLVTTPAAMRDKFAIDVRVRNEVIKIDRVKKTVQVKDLSLGKTYTESYDYLILSPGAAAIKPPIPGIDKPGIFSLRNLEDMDRIKAAVKGKTSAVVVGGGYIGLEMTESLRHIGLEVTLVELANQVMGPADPEMATMLHTEIKMNAVNLRLGQSVTSFEEGSNGLRVILSSGDKIAADAVVMAIGVRPENQLARDAGLDIGVTGGIKVDSFMQTSDAAIYAVGDAVEVKDLITGKPALIPLAGPANRQGRIAVDNIYGLKREYRDTQGSAVCKIFDLTFAMTGLSEKQAVKNAMRYDKVYVHPSNHASYYPGATSISLKMIYDPDTGRVLGAQAVGLDGVEKRIDVLAVAIRAGMTVYDLEEIELCYAPPYGSAKDPVNYAGFVAANLLRGHSEHFHATAVPTLKSDQKLLDVRTLEEVQAGMIPGAMHIPLHELREKISGFSPDKEYMIYCQAGLRGYLAYRILKQHGLRACNLDGGYKTYCMFNQTAVYDKSSMSDDAGSEAEVDKSVVVAGDFSIVKTLDVSGLQCPGPISQLRKAIDAIEKGQAVEILSTDPGFAADVPAWCRSTGHQSISVEKVAGGKYRAVVRKLGQQSCSPLTTCQKQMSNVIFSNDFDKAMAALIIANGAVAAGYKVTLFFTFWGLSLLRKESDKPLKKDMMEKMFGMMLPKNIDGLKLSKMNMGGMGTAMMHRVMASKNVASLKELLQQAIENGIKMVACSMSMDVMGIKESELIDGVELGGVAMYIDELSKSNAGLFI